MIQTRLGPLVLSSHIVRAGQTLTGTSSHGCLFSFTIKNLMTPCPFNWAGFLALGKRVGGCGEHDASCSVRISVGTGNVSYGFVQLGITNIQGVGISNDYYAVVSKNAALIEGTVLNKAHQPIPGATLDVYGAGHGEGNYEISSGPDGTYAIEVTPGSYRIVPSAGSVVGHTTFAPSDAHVTVAAGRTAYADFTAAVAEVIRVSLSTSTVPADGFHIVQGTVSVSLDGKPQPNVPFDLWPQMNETSEQAVTTGSRVTLCYGATRIWPTGTLPDPTGLSVQETTDQTGTYKFTLDAGTVPGQFSVSAWLLNGATPSLSYGSLLTADPADSSDTKTLALSPLQGPGGSMTVAGFVGELQALKSTVQLKDFTNDAGNDTAAFAALAAKGLLGGLAFSWINGTNGTTAVLVYDASNPPTIDPKTSAMKAIGALVVQPNEWVGTPNVPDLQHAIQGGGIKQPPTFAQWLTGASGVAGWNLASNTAATPWTTNFNFNGWPYLNTAPGACD